MRLGANTLIFPLSWPELEDTLSGLLVCPLHPGPGPATLPKLGGFLPGVARMVANAEVEL